MQIKRAASATRRRELIVSAALDVLADQGANGLTFARVCAAANLSSSRLITYHFTDRAGLLNAVTERVLRDMGAWVGGRLGSTRPGVAQLRAFFEANASFMAANRGHVVALVSAFMAGGGAAAGPASQQTQSAVASLVQLAIDVGDIGPVDPAHVAFMMMRCIEGLAMAVVADPELDPLAHARSMADILVNGLVR
ncbi:MAG: TetR family transcriptional regulator [Micropruina sp.]|uniref:TetR/AcrR family transcriptional regulator n=1 Tax=Micropruina sp. TaxID=2737536 RepID=UPI0039E5B2C6